MCIYVHGNVRKLWTQLYPEKLWYIHMLYVSLIYREVLRNPAIKIYLRRVARTQKQINCIRSQDGRLRILISQTRARDIKFVNL